SDAGSTPGANGAPDANGAQAAATPGDASTVPDAARVVTLPPDASSNGSEEGPPAEAAHARRGMKGLFWRDEG
ncbi:MAG: hypothetical protein M3271_04685, partial [Actinomycetota bacterium]|nr:hypothetical protein [Actinomycetota bacterium]